MSLGAPPNTRSSMGWVEAEEWRNGYGEGGSGRERGCTRAHGRGRWRACAGDTLTRRRAKALLPTLRSASSGSSNSMVGSKEVEICRCCCGGGGVEIALPAPTLPQLAQLAVADIHGRCLCPFSLGWWAGYLIHTLVLSHCLTG